MDGVAAIRRLFEKTRKKGKTMQYEIVGAPFPAVVCTLQRGEKMKTERGSMVWMDPCMKMDTGSEGGIGGFFSDRKSVV